jgi:predicted PurR-regulated permease PerM
MSNVSPPSTEWSRPLRYYVLTLLIVGVLAFAWLIRAVFPPLIIAGLIAYLLTPAVEYLAKRTRLKRGVAVAIVFFGGLLVLVGLPALLLPSLIGESEQILSSVEALFTDLQQALGRPIVLFDYRITLAPLAPDFSEVLSNGITALSVNAFVLVEAVTRNLLWSLVTAVATYFFMLDWRKLREALVRLTPAGYEADALVMESRIQAIWSGYLRGNLLLMLIVGVTFTLAWTALGVPGALLLGLIAGLLTIIPDLGPSIAAGLAVAVALVSGSTYLPLSNTWFALLVLAVYVGLINIKNIWLRPVIFGSSVKMHAGLVFVAIIVAVVVEGILGALVVVPVLASAGVVLGYLYRKVMKLPSWD